MEKLLRFSFLATMLIGLSACAPGLVTNDKELSLQQPQQKRGGSNYGVVQTGAFREMNLIMISINNIGVEHMSLYGYKRKTTPNLDKWSERALVFEDAFSPVSWTLPAISSVFTSLYPYTHGVLDRYHGNLLNPRTKTLPGILRENNYQTAAFTGGLDYMKLFGHMQGFTVTDDNPPFTGFNTTLKQAEKWLSRNSNKKFFLFIQGYDAHPPFTSPKRLNKVFVNTTGKKISVDPSFVLRGFKNSSNQYVAYYVSQGNSSASENKKASLLRQEVILSQDDIDYLRDLYDEEVLSVDDMVGGFLNSLNKSILNNTIIVIFSEHGEMFAKHGRFGRAGVNRGTLYDDVIHVPLVIAIAGQKGKRIKGLVQLIDIMPTLLEMLDIRDSERMQGKSLLPIMNNSKPVNDFVYAGALYNIGIPAPYFTYKEESINESIRSYDWKLIHETVFSKSSLNRNPREDTLELYDLKNDPAELNNVADRYPDKTRELKAKLENWVNSSRSYKTTPANTSEFPEALVDDARKHGYW